MEGAPSGGMTIPNGPSSGMPNNSAMTNTSGMTNPIIEDDQPLYDWGIENRLDQYYQDDQNGENCAPPQPYYGQSREYSTGPPPSREYPNSPTGRDYRTPPPAHQEYSRIPQYRQERMPDRPGPGAQVQGTVIKEEPGLDMSQWSHPGYQGGHYRYKLPPTSPGSFPAFSLDANEALKVERKRARNRVAASKCRMRKIEKIQTLDQQTSCLKADNDELAGIANKLREQVYKLQQELQWHVNNGCQVSERAAKAAELLAETEQTSTSSPTKPVLPLPQIASPDSTTAPPIETMGPGGG